jgi:hypothetical protein
MGRSRLAAVFPRVGSPSGLFERAVERLLRSVGYWPTLFFSLRPMDANLSDAGIKDRGKPTLRVPQPLGLFPQARFLQLVFQDPAIGEILQP